MSPETSWTAALDTRWVSAATPCRAQRQRVALARALLADPAVLVLDDATCAIDAVVEDAIHRGLRTRSGARTTILITHRLSTIDLADRVVLIEDGRIVVSGDHRELLATEPRYARVLDRDPAPELRS